ncbi:hypothetical protein [Cesiribacter sp. SM1]|uniref:hypothetical protein n=1 Tax=Cesiribacter sp. SM1 TaxID=2861196 RepID=UPI001CD1EA65|nr:hypothetical protein [Cesiribacter sp. SM1]
MSNLPPISVLILALILFSSCESKEKETVVVWERNPEGYGPLHGLYQDTLGKEPYSNPVLPFVSTLDSILSSYSFEELESSDTAALGDYQFDYIQTAEFMYGGERIRVMKGSLYHKDWPWNEIFLYSDRFGVVAIYPGHSYSQHYLRKKFVDGDLIFELKDSTLNFLMNDTVLNPIPPMPKEVFEIEVIEMPVTDE